MSRESHIRMGIPANCNAVNVAEFDSVLSGLNDMRSSKMDEFIQLVTKQLGVDRETGKSATGGVLKLLKEQLGSDLFAQVREKLPGASGLISDAEDSGDSGGGLMGSLTSMAGSLMGGKAKGVADITAALTKSGLSLDKAPQFMSILIDFLKQKLGNDLFATVAAKLPDMLGKK